MAQKQTITVYAENDNGTECQVYVEGPLFVYQGRNNEWGAGRVKSGWGVCGSRRWKMKRDALAYIQRLMDYNEDGLKLNWDFEKADEMYVKNDK